MFKPLLMILFLFVFSLTTTQAAPFLTCDPYPPDKAQPDTFLIMVGSAGPITSPAFRNPDGSVVLKFDLAGIGAGPQTVRVRAKNAWGESGDSNPFTFTAGKPASAAGLRLVAGDSGSAP